MEPDAGWYADPQDPGRLRYWTGSDWTDQTMAAGGRIVSSETVGGGSGGPARRGWPRPTTILAGAAAVVLITGLVWLMDEDRPPEVGAPATVAPSGQTTTTPPDPSGATPTTPSPTPTDAPTPDAATSTSSSGRLLAQVATLDLPVAYTEETIVSLAQATCRALDAGTPWTSVRDSVIDGADTAGLPDALSSVGPIMGAAVGTMCPAHTAAIAETG